MAISLSRQTAQKIVETVKDVCGHDINFINTKGIIFASTNAERIGNFHEIGKKVVDQKETIEVESDDSFLGTHKGVNIPFTYNREVVAVIGISGIPDEVRKYAVLAQKISSLILREQEIDFVNYSRKSWLNYMIRGLIEGTDIDYNNLKTYMDELNLDINEHYRTILIRLNPRYNPSNLSMIENHIYRTFEQIDAPLYTFHFPNEYILLLPETQYQKQTYVFHTLANQYKHILVIGIGNMYSLWRQNHSYQSAKTAIGSLSRDENYACFDELDLEILLGCVSDHIREEYLSKTISALNDDALLILQTYFEQDLSLKDTADKLFIHKNTLQYQLNKIKNQTGYDPRNFHHAVKLFLALKLK